MTWWPTKNELPKLNVGTTEKSVLKWTYSPSRMSSAPDFPSSTSRASSCVKKWKTTPVNVTKKPATNSSTIRTSPYKISTKPLATCNGSQTECSNGCTSMKYATKTPVTSHVLG